MGAIYLVDGFEIAETDLQTVNTALLKIFIIVSSSVTNPVSLFVKNNERHKYHIDRAGVGNSSIHGFMNVPGVFLKCGVGVHPNRFHLLLNEVRLGIQKFYRRALEFDISIKQVSIGFMIFFNWPVRKQMIDLRQIHFLKLN